MAASGFTPIQLYYSVTATNVPLAANLTYGELAINAADMKLYAKNSSGVVTLLASNASSSATVSSVAVSGGTTGLTTTGGPITTSGTITFAGTLIAANGGTGFSSYTTGDMLYASGATTISKLTLGALNYVLTAGASGPQYVAQSTLSVGTAATATNIAGGAANRVVYQTGAGTTNFAPAPTTANYVLTWNGTTIDWASVPSISTAGNLVGGAAGNLVYQSATNVSAFLSDIAVGNALITGGVGVAPSYGKIGLTTHVTGTLPVANGGTNITSYTIGDIVYASASTTLASLADVAVGNALISGGVGVAPSYGKIGLTTHVSGTLPVANGGTNASSASITAFNNITGYTASGATGTTSTNIVFSTSPTLTTPLLGTPTSGTLSNCTVDGTNSVGYLNIPQNSQSAAYTLVLADAGKHIFHPSTDANARTFTIPANSSVAYAIGTAITFINMTSQVVTIAITTDTMYLSSAGTTGSRSLAQYGSATAIKMTSTTWLISGSGLT